MVETLRVFLSEDALVTLQDKYIEQDETAIHRFIFGIVRDMARSAKMVLMSGELALAVFDEIGQMRQEKITLKEITKPEIVHNKDWMPESKGEKLVPYELKVGEKTYGLLITAYEHYLIRGAKYNESLPVNTPDGRPDLNRKQKLITLASCFEEFLHGGLIMPIMQEVENSINSELDKEFDSIYPPKQELGASHQAPKKGFR